MAAVQSRKRKQKQNNRVNLNFESTSATKYCSLKVHSSTNCKTFVGRKLFKIRPWLHLPVGLVVLAGPLLLLILVPPHVRGWRGGVGVAVEEVHPDLGRHRRQDLVEGRAELCVENRVDDRIEGRVRVAEPGQNLKSKTDNENLTNFCL